MFKKIILASVASLAFSAPAFATHLPAEDWPAMNPTVQVVSYKGQFNGSINGVSSGSGTLISPNGLIVTNNHVIFDDVEQRPLDAFGICITFDVKKEPLCHYTASLVAHDKELDLAILKLDSSDVLGNSLPRLKYLDYSNPGAPQEKQEVQVVGYPASGGDTITISKGQISGFDTFNGYKYFKTDTDFDHGSSGGTVLDQNGNYIGIPTYIRSYAENVGYFLDLREAVPWIQENKDQEPQQNQTVYRELARQMARFTSANETLHYSMETYPYLNMELPTGWHFFEIDEDRIFAAEKNVNDGVGVNVRVEYYPFPIDEGYLSKLDEEFLQTKKAFPDFKKEAVNFNGIPAKRITYTSYNQRNTLFYIPYGYALVGISYGINLDKEARQKQALEPVLASLQFTREASFDPNLPPAIQFEKPPFSIKTAGTWRLQKTVGSMAGDRLVRGIQANNFEGQLDIDYRFTPRDERELPAKEKLDQAIKGAGRQNMKVLAKKEDVILDGLKGFLYSFEYEGELYQQLRKKLVLKLNHGEYEWNIEYDDLSRNFDNNLSEIRDILLSFQYSGEPLPDAGKSDLGTLGERFKDIRHHRFAKAISELAEKGMVTGYPDGRFRPEFFMRRADALKTVLESKNAVERERGLGKEVNFEDYGKDEKNGRWFEKYVKYAQEKEYIDSPRGLGGNDIEDFEPYHAITLAEALEWIMGVYEIPVWQGDMQVPNGEKPWMDKGYELGLIPRGLDDPHQKLTRAEFCGIIYNVYNQAK